MKLPMCIPLARSFFEPSAKMVAPCLVGHWLIRRTPEGICGGIIVETEAYLEKDPACHGYRGETARNRSMYGPPGRAYVYFIYGNHYCVNAVCRPQGCAEAVLIRGITAALTEKWMRARRPVTDVHQLTNGPAKLCAALGIDRQLDGVDLCDANSPLLIARNSAANEFRQQFGPVITTTRVGISRAADLPLRFYLAQSPFVSRRVSEKRPHAAIR